MSTTKNSCESAQSCSMPQSSPLYRSLISGAVGGIAGGLVFGMMMAKMNMLVMIAHMMGSDSAVLGFAIHLMISIVFGMFAGVLLRFIPSCPGKTGMAAIAYGVLLWVIGPLLIMPLMMHMPLFVISPASKASLMGHVIYALVTMFVSRLFTAKVCNKH